MLLNRTSLALANLADKDSSRYSLNAIAVQKNCTVVTNGHYLLTVDHQTAQAIDQFPETPGLEPTTLADNETVLIDRDAALAAEKALPKKSNIPVLKHAALSADRKLYVNQLDSVQAFKSEVTGTFPNWQAVVPKKKPKAEVVLSAAYLELLAKFFRQHGSGQASIPVRLTIYEGDGAVRFDAKSKDEQFITALLMPLRSEPSSFAKRPDQLKADAKAAAQAAKEAAEAQADAEADMAEQAEADAAESTVDAHLVSEPTQEELPEQQAA